MSASKKGFGEAGGNSWESLETFCAEGPAQERQTRRVKMAQGEPDPCHIHTHVSPESTNQTFLCLSPVFLLGCSHTAEIALFYKDYGKTVLQWSRKAKNSTVQLHLSARQSYCTPASVAGKAQSEHQPLASPCHYCICGLQQWGSAFAGLKSFSGLHDPLMANANCRAEYLIHCILPQSRLS